jgi:hypothetical protein
MPALSPEFEALLAKCTPADEAEIFERLAKKRIGQSKFSFDVDEDDFDSLDPAYRAELERRTNDRSRLIPIEKFVKGC